MMFAAEPGRCSKRDQIKKQTLQQGVAELAMQYNFAELETTPWQLLPLSQDHGDVQCILPVCSRLGDFTLF